MTEHDLNRMQDYEDEAWSELVYEAEHNKWISVEDRLPDKNQRVWVKYDGYTSHSGVRWDRPGMWDCVWHGEGWSVQDIARAQKRFDADVLEVTHWMPLPDPPGEE